MQDAGPIVQILRTERQVQSILMAEGGDVGRRCAVAEHLLDGVARNQVDEQKDQRHHQPDNRKRECEAGENLLHGLALNDKSGVRGRGSGVRDQGQRSEIRDQGSGIRRQGSEISDRGDVFYWLNADAGDAAGVHFDDRQATAFEVDAFAFPGNVAEAHEQEAG